ncbi:Alpha/Beta hydrolase protein [Microdochium trichocladiopsis]|uniref:Alpha/Beta hydrolase protein n=1 Tax=Microdochium trichocladiopsis TaxID=1682393 RepID=A0A9P9BIL5_9PEZI|nr:Alpha/Beta hydrolase protein [Microdochium trichocladiopsis]KAH7014475.1 Alpha/Beta hydrolase protein [Microdochium trichocladiopsis]
MTTPFNFNTSQQVYCLSAASNAVGSKQGTEADLQQAMDDALASKLPQVTGDWEVSWGPKVYKPMPEESGPVENVWFAAVSESQKLVVVAVSGTAPPSIKDWLDDIDVERVVNFGTWVGSWSTSTGVPVPVVDKSPDTTANAYIANGTATGVYNILSNTDPKTNTYLWQYLQTITPDYNVIFTGHSMGGAISPTLALGLKQAGMISAGQAYAMPSAGPSPGNANFVALYRKLFPVTVPPQGGVPDYGTLNTDFYNTDDIVPQAWSILPTDDRNLNNITSQIYTWAKLDTDWLVYLTAVGLVGQATRCSAASKVAYAPIPGTAFTSPIDGGVPQISSFADLGGSILRNHTSDYWTYIGVQAFVDEFDDKVVQQPGVEPLPETPIVAAPDSAAGGATGVLPVKAKAGAGSLVTVLEHLVEP